MSLLKYLFYLLIFFGALIYFALATHYGSVLTVKLIAKCMPGHLQIQKMRGQIIAEMEFENIRYTDKQYQFVIESLNFKWLPWQLFNKKIVFNSIKIEHAQINLEPVVKKQEVAQPTNTFDMLGILNYLMINHLNFNDIHILRNRQLYYQLDKLILSKLQEKQYDFHLISSTGILHGQFKLSTLPDLTWNVSLRGEHINSKIVSDKLNSDINFNLSSNGIWRPSHKKIQLQISQIEGTFQEFPVQGLIAMDFADGKLTIHDSKLNIANSIAHIAGTVTKDWDIKWQLTIPQLEKIIPQSRGYFSTNGKITGPESGPLMQAEVTGSDIQIQEIGIKKLTGSLSSALKLSNAKFVLQVNALETLSYHIPNIDLQINSQRSGKKLNANVELAFSTDNHIQGKISLPEFQTLLLDKDQSIIGNFNVDFRALNEIIAIPEVRDLNGRLQGSINVAGKIAEPIVSFDAHLKEGFVYIPRLRTSLEQINLQANCQAGQLVRLSGNFKAGEGLGAVDGQIKLQEAGLPMTFNLNGSNLRLANLNEYKIIVSPNLNVTYVDQITHVDGHVVIPFAEITPKDFSSVTTLPSEVVIQNKENQSPQTNVTNNFALNVQIILGQHIVLAYENLNTSLSGKLMISQRPGTPPVATGELKAINGKYQAYGKTLTIQQGRLIYTGNILANPGLDVRATQQYKMLAYEGGENMYGNNELKSIYMGTTKTLTVGVSVKGTLTKPKISLFSDAGLSQNDILSYLVFGYPQSQIKTANKLAILNNLASGLYQHNTGVGGATQKVKNVLGLSDISVGEAEYFDPETHSTANTTAISVSKQIGRNLSLRYSVGIFNSISILNLRYQINKRLALQSQASSVDTGADLIYEFEKD